MSKKKILTVVGTRPEFIKLSETIKLIDKLYDHILVNTNQNFEYELNKIFFKDLKIRKPDYTFETKDKNAIEKISDNFIKIEKIIKAEKPDAMLILGDTNTGLVVYVAKRLKIPIFHIEAGNRCFDQRVPEEINRKVIDHLSDVNLVYSDISRSYLIQENFPPQNIIKVGSPIKEIFEKNKIKINKSNILKKLKLKKNDYFLISFHREEHLDKQKKLSDFIHLISHLDKNFKSKIIISTHYKLKDRLRNFININKSNKIKFLKPFGFFDYSKLLINSRMVLSDSGTLNEESSVMGFNAINLRDTHERPEADEEAVTVLTSLDINLISEIIKQKHYKKPNLVKDYDVNDFSLKVSKVIGGYINKIERDVWKKY
tara:strand:- start:2012 stop:3127 length:1116 start_codon:yes stop_codon:yes gene_type:complete